jgi:hypothetical protein
MEMLLTGKSAVSNGAAHIQAVRAATYLPRSNEL